MIDINKLIENGVKVRFSTEKLHDHADSDRNESVEVDPENAEWIAMLDEEDWI